MCVHSTFADSRIYAEHLQIQKPSELKLIFCPAGNAPCAKTCWATIATGIATGCWKEAAQKLLPLMTPQLPPGCTSRAVSRPQGRAQGIPGPLQPQKMRSCLWGSLRSRHSMTAQRLSAQSAEGSRSLLIKGRLVRGAATRLQSMLGSLSHF